MADASGTTVHVAAASRTHTMVDRSRGVDDGAGLLRTPPAIASAMDNPGAVLLGGNRASAFIIASARILWVSGYFASRTESSPTW
jgi:hypothetical protein